MPDWLTNLITGSVIAVITAAVTVRLSLRRFHAERWWERKVDAYSGVLDALYHMKRYADHLANEEMGERFSDEYRNDLEKKHSEAFQELERATTIGGYILSDEVAATLAELQEHPRDTWDKVPPWEFFESEAVAYGTALTKIRDAAKRDLRVP